tara:strand:+ start:484 stop:837 length:354 start_codon:yes stop_codon:yes gene_type:complete
MKISKRQLKRIIKEEKAKILNENFYGLEDDEAGGTYSPGGVRLSNPSEGLKAELIVLEGILDGFSSSVDKWFTKNNDDLEDMGLLDDPESWAIRLEDLRIDVMNMANEILGGNRRIQ